MATTHTVGFLTREEVAFDLGSGLLVTHVERHPRELAGNRLDVS